MINLPKLNKLQAENLPQLDQLLDLQSVLTGISLLGTRTLTIINSHSEKAVVDLNELALSLIYLYDTLSAEGSALSTKENQAAIKLSKKLFTIYSGSEKQVKLSHCIARFFVALREWWATLGVYASMHGYMTQFVPLPPLRQSTPVEAYTPQGLQSALQKSLNRISIEFSTLSRTAAPF